GGRRRAARPDRAVPRGVVPRLRVRRRRGGDRDDVPVPGRVALPLTGRGRIAAPVASESSMRRPFLVELSGLLLASIALAAGCAPKTGGSTGPQSCAGGIACPVGQQCAWDARCYPPGAAPQNPNARDMSALPPDLTVICTQASC